MSDEKQIYVQRVEFLAAAPGQAKSGEPTVILTIRPDWGSFRPHNIALSRPQAARLLKSLQRVLRQMAGILVVVTMLASSAGCSADVDLTSQKSLTDQHARITAAVTLLDRHRPSSMPVADPSQPPTKTVEVTGNANFVIVVDGGDLTIGDPHHDDQSAPPATAWNTKIPWLTDLRGAGPWTVGCYLAVVTLVVAAVALLISNIDRDRGGFLLLPVAMLFVAAVLLQLLPHTESGLHVVPLAPWNYSGWLPFGISLLSWMAIISATYVAVSGCLDAPQVFAFFALVAIAFNGLLGFATDI